MSTATERPTITTQMVVERAAEMRRLSENERNLRITYGTLMGTVVDARRMFLRMGDEW